MLHDLADLGFFAKKLVPDPKKFVNQNSIRDKKLTRSSTIAKINIVPFGRNQSQTLAVIQRFDDQSYIPNTSKRVITK